MDIKQLLFEHLLKMEHYAGRHISLKAFSKMLGIEYTYFNHIYNLTQAPSEKVIIVLADYFDDPRFYDVAGLQRPDPMLRFVIRTWGALSLEGKEKISKIVKYAQPSKQD